MWELQVSMKAADKPTEGKAVGPSVCINAALYSSYKLSIYNILLKIWDFLFSMWVVQVAMTAPHLDPMC